MKILYVTPGCFDKSGISRYSRYQITALRELFGENNIVVYSLLGKTTFTFEDNFTVTWSAGGKWTDKKSTGYSKIRMGFKIISVCLRWKPDIIHVAHVSMSGICHIMAKLIKAKLIINVYGLEIWSGLSFDSRLGFNHATKIISDCHFTKNYILQQKLRDENDIQVIWDCVDLNKFFPAPPSAEVCKKYGIPDPNKYKIILTLGRLTKIARHKGYERLIHVFARLTEKSNNLYLVFGSDGNLRPELENLAKDLGISGKVIFTGSINESDLPAIYQSAYIFSLISDRGIGRGEGLPLTPLEAMACGVPVLVGNHDGSQEAVIDGNGIVVDPFDLDSHIAWLNKLIEDPVFYAQLKESAIKISKIYFSFEAFKDKHAMLYQSLTNS